MQTHAKQGSEVGSICTQKPMVQNPAGCPAPFNTNHSPPCPKPADVRGRAPLPWRGVSGKGRLSHRISWNSGTHLHTGTTLGSSASWSQASASHREGRRNRAWSSVDRGVRTHGGSKAGRSRGHKQRSRRTAEDSRGGGGLPAASPRACRASVWIETLFPFADGVSSRRSWDSSIFRSISCLDTSTNFSSKFAARYFQDPA